MSDHLSRRDAIKQLGTAGASLMLGARTFRLGAAGITIAGEPVEITVASLSPVTARITIKPIRDGHATEVPLTGELVAPGIGTVAARGSSPASVSRVRSGDLVVELHEGPPVIEVKTRTGAVVQRLTFDAAAPGMSFLLGNGPLLGLGEGGPQFDRRGSADRMVRGQGGYRLATHGTRAPIQWLVGTDGWAMFIHQPYGAFDFHRRARSLCAAGCVGAAARRLRRRGTRSADHHARVRAHHGAAGDAGALDARLPAVASHARRDPTRSLGVARTMREKKLPCDTLIYLGTEFAPSGWNTRNGEFTWHPTNFPESEGDARRAARRALQGRACTSSSRDGISPAP